MNAGSLRDSEIERIDRLLAGLEDPTDIDVTVHETRKGMKRLRAHLRLIADAIDPAVYRSEDAELRAIGRLLAPARDSFVLGQTLESLETSEGWEPAAEIIARNHRAAVDELMRGPIKEVRHRLAEARERWPAHAGDEVAVVRAGMSRTYERGRSERDVAASTGQAKDFHNWRKRVKYLRYQLEAVDADEALVAALTGLGELLGLEHDHTVFIDFCDDQIDLLPDRRDRYVLIDRAETRRDELRAAAIATDAFTDETDAFIEAVFG